MVEQSCYWVMNEHQALQAARDWATDCRHADNSESACKERLETVRSFLFSRQTRRSGLLKQADPDYDGRTKGE